MKKITLLFTAFLLLAGVSLSAQKKGGEARAQALSDSLKVKLSLDDEQYKKVQAINLEYINKARDLKAASGDRRSKATELKGWSEERDAAFQKVLTTQQFETFKANKHMQRKAMKEGGLRKSRSQTGQREKRAEAL